MTIKLLATDLDGTLLRSGKPVSAGNVAAAQEAAKAGTIVTIATGRMYRAAMPVAEALGLDVPIITYNGALIKSTSGKIYYEQYLDEDICRRVVDFAAARNWYLQTYSGDELYYSACGEFSQRYEYSQKVKGKTLGYAGMREQVSRMYKMLVITDDPAVTQDWMAELQVEFGDRITLTQSSKDFIEIISPGVSKAAALVRLADMLHIDIRETMAIGDASNDLPMLEAAGFSVAMGNATAEVKAVTDAVTGHCDEDGWAQAVHKYILNRE
ncbi:MAG: Cof-type HAD-IIB family hydrolase [Selenomonas sp.]|uniref:Cof-type HAD-IIB family hydrolase n=1 Tax=Selenomonas sp. TaxID=2053611 RepID=UPI0025E1A575|nr:Cof-type HAD-IIB family hydrolase [Selenomonas sp.]MCR5758695.1 Cof-type HAD-IIB family hydrolase [Selenomonas sp.]